MILPAKVRLPRFKPSLVHFVSFSWVFLFSFLYPLNLFSQQLPVNDPYREYLQVLAINGNLEQAESSFYLLDHKKFIPSSLNSFEHPWRSAAKLGFYDFNEKNRFYIAPYDPVIKSYWQTLEPGGTHDGPVWQGRGLTTDFSTGFFARYGILSASFNPHIIFNQNRSFSLSPYDSFPNRSSYAYPLGSIDLPQRFGDGSFWDFALGNTYIRADYHGWATGISNEQMRWGPARQNGILLDSNAPGFRHFFIGTSQPKDIYIGYLKTKVFWGKLLESDYFDEVPSNDERFISGLTLSINPKPIPGLTLGINRVFYETIPPDGIPVGDLLKVFEAFTKKSIADDSNPGGNDQGDQLISIFGQWTFPESGLEIYGEWARTDHSWDWRDFFSEPEHSRGYTLGLQKTFQTHSDNILSINAELTQLEASKTGIFRGFPTFYVHGRSPQGYSNQGQLLGASIGPGSSSQYIDGTLFFGDGRIKIFAQRVALNNDFLYKSDAMLNPDIQNPNTDKYLLHNTEMRFGTSLLYFYKQFEGSIGFTYRRELNDDYIYNRNKNHLGVKLMLRYKLSNLR